MSHDFFSSFSSDELQSAIDSKLLRGMLDTMPVAVTVLVMESDGVSFRYVFTNQTATAMAGKPLAGTKILADDDPVLVKQMAAVAATGKRKDFLHHYTASPEKWIHYSISRFDHGVMLTYENVTQRKRAKTEFELERYQLAQTQAISHIGSFEWDVMHDRFHWSDELFRINGLEPQSQEITRGAILSLVHPEDRDDISLRMERYRKERISEEVNFRTITPENKIKHLHAWIKTFPDAAGKISHVRGMVEDLTLKREADDALHEIREKLRQQTDEKERRQAKIDDLLHVMDNTLEAIILADGKGYVTFWNAGAESLLGMSASDTVGHQLDKIFNSRFQHALAAAGAEVTGGNIVSDVPMTLSPDGQSVQVLANIVPIKDRDGKISGTAMLLRKAAAPGVLSQDAEAILKEKNRELRALNNELKTFTSVAAYDYKETLQNLYTNLEFIITREAQNLSNTGKANLRKAQTAIQKMKLLTDDIVDFSKIRTPDSEPAKVELNEIIGTVLDELTVKITEAGAIIQKQPLPAIQGYPFLLELLFFHLLDNAVKFRSDGRALEISIEHGYSADRETGARVHSITIADNGIGFPQEEASNIFRMFYKIHDKKYRGSGIGLAICKKITDLHGGTMAVESTPGTGTKVCCFFPVS
jgi:PAS domain S-box-containing protein